MQERFLIRRKRHGVSFFKRIFRSFFFNKNGRVKIDFSLTISCWYPVIEGHNDQLQKIAGVSFGPFHHRNSIRLVFLPDSARFFFHIYAYWYKDGKAPEPLSSPNDPRFYLGTVYAGQDVRAVIDFKKGNSSIDAVLLGNKQSKVIETPKWKSLLLFRLWPYIELENKKPAQQQMLIFLTPPY